MIETIMTLDMVKGHGAPHEYITSMDAPMLQDNSSESTKHATNLIRLLATFSASGKGNIPGALNMYRALCMLHYNWCNL